MAKCPAVAWRRTGSERRASFSAAFARGNLRHVPCLRRIVPPRRPLVLVAEDEPEASELIAMLLRREGCEVPLARGGATALELEMARQLPRPDPVLLDLELPVMDGREFLAAFRADPSLSGIPVCVVSGAADAKSVRATENVRKSRLLDGLQRVLARLRGEMPPEREPESLLFG